MTEQSSNKSNNDLSENPSSSRGKGDRGRSRSPRPESRQPARQRSPLRGSPATTSSTQVLRTHGEPPDARWVAPMTVRSGHQHTNASSGLPRNNVTPSASGDMAFRAEAGSNGLSTVISQWMSVSKRFPADEFLVTFTPFMMGKKVGKKARPINTNPLSSTVSSRSFPLPANFEERSAKKRLSRSLAAYRAREAEEDHEDEDEEIAMRDRDRPSKVSQGTQDKDKDAGKGKDQSMGKQKDVWPQATQHSKRLQQGDMHPGWSEDLSQFSSTRAETVRAFRPDPLNPYLRSPERRNTPADSQQGPPGSIEVDSRSQRAWQTEVALRPRVSEAPDVEQATSDRQPPKRHGRRKLRQPNSAKSQ